MLNAKFDADSLLCLLSHFECDGHTVHISLSGVYAPTDQFSKVVIVHTCAFQSSPWLPSYIDVAQTVLIILTMAGLFLDRHCIHFSNLLIYILCSSIKISKWRNQDRTVQPQKHFRFSSESLANSWGQFPSFLCFWADQVYPTWSHFSIHFHQNKFMTKIQQRIWVLYLCSIFHHLGAYCYKFTGASLY